MPAMRGRNRAIVRTSLPNSVKLRAIRFEKELADRQVQRTSGHKSNKSKVLIGCIARAHTQTWGSASVQNGLDKSLPNSWPRLKPFRDRGRCLSSYDKGPRWSAGTANKNMAA